MARPPRTESSGSPHRRPGTVDISRGSYGTARCKAFPPGPPTKAPPILGRFRHKSDENRHGEYPNAVMATSPDGSIPAPSITVGSQVCVLVRFGMILPRKWLPTSQHRPLSPGPLRPAEETSSGGVTNAAPPRKTGRSRGESDDLQSAVGEPRSSCDGTWVRRPKEAGCCAVARTRPSDVPPSGRRRPPAGCSPTRPCAGSGR